MYRQIIIYPLVLMVSKLESVLSFQVMTEGAKSMKKTRLRRSSHNGTSPSFQLLVTLALLYGLFGLSLQLVTPTQASFHDTVTVEGTVSASHAWNDEQNGQPVEDTEEKRGEKETAEQEVGSATEDRKSQESGQDRQDKGDTIDAGDGALENSESQGENDTVDRATSPEAEPDQAYVTNPEDEPFGQTEDRHLD